MLRDYQDKLVNEVRDTWERSPRVLAVAPCGAGKTRMMSYLAQQCDGPNIAIAHRQELVSQISLAFAAAGVEHRIIAPDAIVNGIIKRHVEEIGRNFHRPSAPSVVAGVDTLIRRDIGQMILWQTDEAHHLQPDNKWGKAVAKFPGARGVGWTATPCRTDRKPLRPCFDEMVVGPSMRELINRGFLSDYLIYGLPQSIDCSNVKVTAGGDFSNVELSNAAHGSHITGDIVKHYQALAAGKSGVTFAVDVKLAGEHAQAFRDAGISAAVLHAKTPGAEREQVLRAFRARELTQIVNVDILGEGFDVPGIEVVSMARPTMSYGLFVQQFGRALRPSPGKERALILDHVGNVGRHGLPDGPKEWSLDVQTRRQTASTVPIRVCGNPECMLVHEGYDPKCPFCGWTPTPGQAERQRPEMIEGDLTLYTPELLTQLRGEADRIAGPVQVPYGLRGPAMGKLMSMWDDRQDAQRALADAIDEWAGRQDGSMAARYRKFYLSFGIDTLGALLQSARKMNELKEKLNERN
jgi:DNA repair protein RadD